MKLREAKAFRALDGDHGRVWHVHTDLDDGRRDEDGCFSLEEGLHRVIFVFRFHAPVQQADRDAL